LISQCSNSQLLIKELRHYYALGLRIWYFLIDRLPPGTEDFHGHSEVVDAIRNRDSALAEKLMRAHCRAVFDTVKTHL
jgi:DNA-binding GntR family transcriptional regulator